MVKTIKRYEGSKKQQVIEIIFDACKRRGIFEFDNEFVKQVTGGVKFANQFDATKVDHSAKLPVKVREARYFILHLGQGRHAFVKGIDDGYHTFEAINEKDRIDWRYRKSVLNEADTSESNVLAVAANQRIIHDFLYEDIVAEPKIYFARRTKCSFRFSVGALKYEAENIQMEIDLTFEYRGNITVLEAKNGFPKDFAVYQLYNPYRTFIESRKAGLKGIEQVSCCYVLRSKTGGNSVLRLYEYTFKKPHDLASIALKKAAEYRLVRR